MESTVLASATFPPIVCTNTWGMMHTAEATPERRLIERTLGGDDVAFGQLVEQHQGVVFNIAYRMLGNRQEAQDVAQETFWRAYRGLRGFDLNRPLAPWLYRIATNLSINRLQRNPPPVISLDAPPESQPQDAPPMEVPDHRASPAERLFQAETQVQIRQAILELAPPDRAVIELRHFQGLSYDEIAAVTGASLSSVKSQLFRARRKLQAHLANLLE
jgi:RNA polymerase sigma-70 factor (ECF subfamily)